MPTTYTLRHDAAEYVIHFVDEGHDSVEVVYVYGNEDQNDIARRLMMREEAKKVWAAAVEDGAKRTS